MLCQILETWLTENKYPTKKSCQNCIFCNIEKLNIIYDKICEETILLKKISKNVKGVVVPPPKRPKIGYSRRT